MIFIKTHKGVVGMGLTDGEAEKDLEINTHRQLPIKKWSSHYLQRRELLSPWCPHKNMLHISSIGALLVDEDKIVNTRTGVAVLKNDGNFDTFTKLLKLFGSALNYEDIMVTCQRDIDMFFNQIDSRYKTIGSLEDIVVTTSTHAITATQLFTTKLGFFLCVGDSEAGIRVFTKEEPNFYMAATTRADVLNTLSYTALRCGYYLVREGVRALYGKEDIFPR